MTFQISLWGGAQGYLLQSLQIIQNKAARLVTRRSKYTPVAELLSQCSWLSVRQLAFYHSTVQIFQSLQSTYPKYIYSKLSMEFPYNTRLADSQSVMGSDFNAKLELTKNSFMHRATSNYNQLPASIRQVASIEVFKSKLKIWVSENIPV